MREKQEKHNARQSRRQSGDDDERVEPRLEVHHNQQVDENDGKAKPGQQTPVRGSHGFELALDCDERSTRKGFSIRVQDAGDVPASRPEIAAVNRSVNVHNAADVVVR